MIAALEATTISELHRGIFDQLCLLRRLSRFHILVGYRYASSKVWRRGEIPLWLMIVI
ncbi:hypothetical protein BU26DRAFT_522131, partial [Trematosphaeria pertusa]